MAKYNQGRRLGEDAWEDDKKWGFGLTERESLDTIMAGEHSTN